MALLFPDAADICPAVLLSPPSLTLHTFAAKSFLPLFFFKGLEMRLSSMWPRYRFSVTGNATNISEAVFVRMRCAQAHSRAAWAPVR